MGAIVESSSESCSGFTEIEIAAESLGRTDIFHVVKEVLGFVLYTHQMIPAVLPHLEHEFVGLKEEYKHLELSYNSQVERKERKASRRTNMRKREVKHSIAKLEKLMKSLFILLSALQEAIDLLPEFHGITLILGGSLAHPYHIYEIVFSDVRANFGNVNCGVKSQVAEALSRKVVRALISNCARSSFFSGPSKLFLLIKCPCTFKSPLHFLPKRDFKYNKKVLPVKLHIKCKVGDQTMNDLHKNPDKINSRSSVDMAVNEMIWYHCRHIVRSGAFKWEETDC